MEERPLHAAQRRLACADKLDRLADFLEALPDDRFNYATWGSTTDMTRNVRPVAQECGTIGCAAGWLDEASGGICRAWDYSFTSNGEPIFIVAKAERYLGLDQEVKVRHSESEGHRDFERLFVDADNKLCDSARGLGAVPKTTVIKRIRACAKDYRKRSLKYLKAHNLV